MLCKKCKRDIPGESVYCNHCGAKQIREKRGTRRGNGQGTAYRAANGTWTAEATIGWDLIDGRLARKTRKKRGFKTKAEALSYLPQLKQLLPPQDANIKLKDLYEKWLTLHAEKVSRSTINCYRSAYKYLADLHYAEVATIKTEHIQNCIDSCPHGTRTRENMKALCTALWRYSMQLDIVTKNYAEYVYIKRDEQTKRTVFTAAQLALLWQFSETEANIKYILILCYTGLRLGELLSAKTADYHPQDGYFITGSKTAAGKNRVITISPKIRHFFRDMGTGEYLFFDQPPTENWFRNKYFYPALRAAGIYDSDITPHCCRHTFATLMKNIDAPATDKQKLIGHSKFEMTAHYTHTDVASLQKITDLL